MRQGEIVLRLGAIGYQEIIDVPKCNESRQGNFNLSDDTLWAVGSSEAAMDGSFAQYGMSPQRTSETWRTLSLGC